jgi:DNA-binding transcriptional regulator YiaG
MDALCIAINERTVSCVAAHVHDQLEKFVPLIQEDFAITEERKQLKEKLKVMQKAFALLHTSRETLQRFRAP